MHLNVICVLVFLLQHACCSNEGGANAPDDKPIIEIQNIPEATNSLETQNVSKDPNEKNLDLGIVKAVDYMKDTVSMPDGSPLDEDAVLVPAADYNEDTAIDNWFEGQNVNMFYVDFPVKDESSNKPDTNGESNFNGKWNWGVYSYYGDYEGNIGHEQPENINTNLEPVEYSFDVSGLEDSDSALFPDPQISDIAEPRVYGTYEVANDAVGTQKEPLEVTAKENEPINLLPELPQKEQQLDKVSPKFHILTIVKEQSIIFLPKDGSINKGRYISANDLNVGELYNAEQSDGRNTFERIFFVVGPMLMITGLIMACFAVLGSKRRAKITIQQNKKTHPNSDVPYHALKSDV